MANQEQSKMEKIVSLSKRRGFVFPGSEIYGGLSNSWDYGPLGVELKNNIKQLWWQRFVKDREDMVGIDAALIMNPKVWEASGHLANFSDPLVECTKCHQRFREDTVEFISSEEAKRGLIGKILEEKGSIRYWKCESCKTANIANAKQFNLMFKTFIGTVEDAKSAAYLRPETAQAMFVDFKNVLDTTRRTLPFGIAQQGKAFRNEVTPGNFIFRTREFEQMEIEYFIAPPKTDADWQRWFEYWQDQMHQWMELIGLDLKKVHDEDIPDGERAHYSKRTIDFMYEFPFGAKELYGLAYRTDFDLKNHFKEPPYRDAQSTEAFWPHVIEPTWGVDRTILAVLSEAYTEDGDRVYLKFKPALAPYKAAVFPLLANKPQLVDKARELYRNLKQQTGLAIAWDERGNIGKRYYAQDEIGTPWCITVDFDTVGEGDDQNLKNTVTVRNRDTAKQERMAIKDLAEFLSKQMRA